MQNEYIDLPINIQQTPKHLLEKAPAYKVPQNPEDAADQLLKSLQNLIKGPSTDLYTFYQTAMPATLKTHFTDKQWPQPSTLEQKLDIQYKPGAQAIYKEFVLRTMWNRIKNCKDADVYCQFIDDAWEEYTFIFQLEATRVNFPAEMIWDYLDSFMEIYLFHTNRRNSITDSKNYNPQKFDPTETKSLLTELTTSIPQTYHSQNLSTKQILSYYSLIGLAQIAINQKNYKEALTHISRISLKQISVFSKGVGSLLTAFFVAAFGHFMLGENYKSVKLCEIVVGFYQKYRKFFDKSFSYYTQLQPMYEKLVILQCINYIYLEEKPKTAVLEIFKNTNVKTKQKEARDKISDCFFKLKQNDLTTFWRLFNFISYQFFIPNLQQPLTESFKNLQNVNLNTIIQNYKRIQLEKISKMLGISIEEVLKQFKSLGAVEKTSSPWDLTIMNPLLKQKKKVNVVIEGNVAVFDSQAVDVEDASREWLRYREEILWLNQKVKAI